MQYDTIEELMLELSLYPNKKHQTLKDCAKHCKYGWFAIAKDGNCALFDDNGNLDDISKVKRLTFTMVPKDIKKIIIPAAIKTIDEYAFQFAESIESIYIPDNVKFIDEGAFEECTSLSSVHLPKDLRTIEQSVFCNCASLQQIELPSNIQYIYDYAFSGCKALKSIVIPPSIKQIGFNAFSYCNSLENLEINLQSEKQYMLLTTYAYPWGIIDYESVIKFKGIAV